MYAHADCNTELLAFLGKMQVIKLAKKRTVVYNTKVFVAAIGLRVQALISVRGS
jgi:hypothetical protein